MGMALCSYGPLWLWPYMDMALYSYALNSYGPYSYGPVKLWLYGLQSYGATELWPLPPVGPRERSAPALHDL